MAIRVASDNYVYSAFAFAAGFSDSAYTLMAWVRPTTLSNSPGLLFCGVGPNWPNGDWCQLGSGANEGLANLVSFSNSTGGSSSAGSESFSTSAWSHVAMVRTSATNLKLYVNGILDVDFTTESTASRLASPVNAAFNSKDYPATSADWQAFKVWDRALSQPEIVREMRQTRAVTYNGLRIDAPIRGGSEAVMFSNEVEGETDLTDGNYGTAPTALYTNAVPYDLRQGSSSVVESAAGGGGVTVTPGSGSATVTAYAPATDISAEVFPGSGNAEAGLRLPIIPTQINTGSGSATATAYAPDVELPVTVTPGSGGATVTGYAPEVGVPVVVTPGSGSSTVTAYAPAVTTGAGTFPGAGEVTVTSYPPRIDIPAVTTPGSGSSTVTAYAPTIGVPVVVTPGPGITTVTTYPPRIDIPGVVEPPSTSVTVTAYAPTVTATQGAFVAPGSGTAVVSSWPPTLASAPVSFVTVKRFSQDVYLNEGDEYFIQLSGPAASDPEVRVVLRFEVDL